MKSYLILLMCLLSFSASAQLTVSGFVKRPNSTNDSFVKYTTVYVGPDTPGATFTFPTIKDITDTTGEFSVQLPANIPLGAKFCMRTLDCDGVTEVKQCFTYNGANTSSSLYICATTTPSLLNGYVYLDVSTKRPSPPTAWVLIFESCGNTIQVFDTVVTDTNGYFKFREFPVLAPNCSVLLQARLRSFSPEYGKYAPAYYAPDYSLRWSTADFVNKSASTGVVIKLPELKNPFGGPAIISGKAESNSNPLPDKVLFVTDMNDVPVAYQHTDATGKFSFANLPFGTYKVFGDVLNKDNPDLVVTVDANNVWVTDIVFIEDTIEFKGTRTTSLLTANNELTPVYIYPNPVKDQLFIRGVEKIDGNKKVIVRNISGAVIAQYDYTTASNVIVPTSELPAGMYLVELQTNTGNKVFKLVK